MGNTNITTAPALSSISTDIRIMPANGTFSITGAMLNAATVNHILESAVENQATGSAGYAYDLSGGTSAGVGALTTAGAAARAALIAAGWTVTLNP
jgi:hypothetical protein